MGSCLYFLGEFLSKLFSSKSVHAHGAPTGREPSYALPITPLGIVICSVAQRVGIFYIVVYIEPKGLTFFVSTLNEP